MINNNISVRTLERLPIYHHLLQQLRNQGLEYVSTTDIAKNLNLKPIQVRKDISVTGIVGKPRIGYLIDELLHSIEHFLGWDHRTNAVLIGCGNLGTSLLGYDDFENYGLHIIMAFENSPGKTGKQIYGKPVYHLKDFERKIKDVCVDLGIITVPKESAQGVAELLYNNGIKAIWNFAPISLKLPSDVKIQQQDMAPCLAVLLSKVHITSPCINYNNLD